MSQIGVMDAWMEEKLLHLHTAFLAKLVSLSGTQATVQPLTWGRQTNGKVVKPAVLANIPILHHALVRFATEPQTCMIGETAREKREHVVLERIQPGATVLCVCAERDITDARKGNAAVPVAGHHEIKDAIVVGWLA